MNENEVYNSKWILQIDYYVSCVKISSSQENYWHISKVQKICLPPNMSNFISESNTPGSSDLLFLTKNVLNSFAKSTN